MRSLSLSLIAVVVASIIAFGWILNQIYIHSSPESHNTDNDPYINIGQQIYNVYQTSDSPKTFIKQWNKGSSIHVSVIDSEDFPIPNELHSNFFAGNPLLLESDEGIGIHYSISDNNEVLTILLPNSQIKAGSPLELILTLSFYAGITTIILIWIWPLIHQLMKLRDAAVKFGKGDLNARVKRHRFCYISDIEKEFNRMADRIQSLVKDNKLLSRAVSHDLKTPVARLRFGLDALIETENVEHRQRYAERINRDLEEMETLVETLLQYARLDEDRIQVTERKINLLQLLEAIIQTYINDDIKFEFECEISEATIFGDKRYITMLINNLLSNSFRYAHSQVHLSLTMSKYGYTLTFEDDGPGIPEKEREHAVKPFWRGDKGRGQKGHGMGLAIVSRIAEWHKANLTINDSQTLGGAKISLYFGFSNQ